MPTKENDFSPHLLQKTAFFLMCGLVMLTFVAVNIQTMLWLSSDWLVSTVLPAVVINETNLKRASSAEVPLARNAKLDAAAQLKAEHMAKNGYFAHYSPEGVSPWYWFDKVSYQYAHAGENLAVHFSDSKAVVDAWMDSPTHKANIMNGQYLEIGVGTAEGEYQGYKTVFVVQLFGTPASPIQPFIPPPPVEEVVEVALAPVPEETLSEVLGETKDLTEMVESVVGAETKIEEERKIEAEIEMQSEITMKLEAEAENETTLPEAPVITEIALAPDRPVEESFTATSSDLVAVPVSVFKPQFPLAGSSAASVLATTPNTVLRIIYVLLGSVIATLLIFSVTLALRYQRPWQVVYGVGLLIIMTGLFYIHSLLTASVVIAAPIL